LLFHVDGASVDECSDYLQRSVLEVEGLDKNGVPSVFFARRPFRMSAYNDSLDAGCLFVADSPDVRSPFRKSLKAPVVAILLSRRIPCQILVVTGSHVVTNP
jgi:hypothetical protein